jgi:hypothetical protein
VYSRFQRALHRLRTVDLDRRSGLPKAVTVVSADEFGPLVIAIVSATVFPDGSVKARGRWITSAKFGLSAPRQRSTATIRVNIESAVVSHPSPGQRDLVESVGPRLATLGRTRPGIPVFVPTTRHPLTETVVMCSLKPAGVLVHCGSSRTMPAALFARVPTVDDRDGQQLGFAELFHHKNVKASGRVYLESDVIPDTTMVGPSLVDVRSGYEQSGSTLVSSKRFWPGDVVGLASVVSGSAELVLETEDMRPFARFAPATTPVTVASLPRERLPNPARKTATSRFDMDAALRNGSTLPRGVDVLSRPNYDVPDTSVDGHRVFVEGKWRTQSDDQLVERSLGPWILSVKNAIVAPNGSVMLEDGTQLGGGYFGEINFAPPVDGWVTDETSRPSGLGLTIHRAFGHGLMQVAPRLDALMQHDPKLDVLVSDVTWDDSFLLQRLGVNLERVRRVPRINQHHLVRVPELVVSTHLHPEQKTARADPIWQAEFVSRFVGEATSLPPRRIYLGRRDSSGVRGGCVNRWVLDELAEECGYETVYPELLSFAEQVALISTSIDVFGEHGSALNWSLFMPSGSRTVLVNSKPMSNLVPHISFQNPVLAARGSRYREINAVRGGRHNYFEVEPRALRRAMEQLQILDA